MAIDMLPRLEVIADEGRIEADRLRLDREVQELCGRELFGRRLVSELEHGDAFLIVAVETECRQAKS
jgi:hypothetical protein